MENTFEQLYDKLSMNATPMSRLKTTGGVPFDVEAREVSTKKYKEDNRAIVSRSGKSTRIYIFKEDWGNRLNTSGTRIYHYAVPVDEWYSKTVLL